MPLRPSHHTWRGHDDPSVLVRVIALQSPRRATCRVTILWKGRRFAAFSPDAWQSRDRRIGGQGALPPRLLLCAKSGSLQVGAPHSRTGRNSGVHAQAELVPGSVGGCRTKPRRPHWIRSKGGVEKPEGHRSATACSARPHRSRRLPRPSQRAPPRFSWAALCDSHVEERACSAHQIRARTCEPDH